MDTEANVEIVRFLTHCVLFYPKISPVKTAKLSKVYNSLCNVLTITGNFEPSSEVVILNISRYETRRQLCVRLYNSWNCCSQLRVIGNI